MTHSEPEFWLCFRVCASQNIHKCDCTYCVVDLIGEHNESFMPKGQKMKEVNEYGNYIFLREDEIDV